MTSSGSMSSSSSKVSRWYFGGLASAGAACCTHPLDLIKVHLQTSKQRMSVLGQTVHLIRSQGLLSIYNGLSASLLRQLTYSTTRFAIYEVSKQQFGSGKDLGFAQRVAMAAGAGAAGGLVGTPADMINVRMQNDVKVVPEKRRNYKHAVDGLVRVMREEGMAKLFNGADWATSRAVLMTVGQLCFYDVIKQTLISKLDFKDNLVTHFTSSLCAGAIATTMTQPLDVCKTRAMNARPGEFANAMHVVRHTLSESGIFAFYKGYVPAFVRLGPHTILTFVFLEQLRKNFGTLPNES